MKIVSPKLPHKASEQSWLVTFTFLYLGIPNLLFVLGWLHWYIALPVTLALLWSGRSIYLENRNAPMPWASSEISRKALWLLLIVASVWILVAGVGGVFRQFGDYDKHNAIIKELSEKAWPVLLNPTIISGEQDIFLCYYVGYYLPTAFFSKLTHISFANYYAFIWSWFGVVLVFFWIKKLSGLKKAALLFLLFPLLSGLDFYAGIYRLAQVFVHHGFEHSFKVLAIYFGVDGSLIFNWGNAVSARNINYHSMNGAISWVPQHAIAGWLAGAWMYWEGSLKQRNTYLGLIVVLVMIFSTFVTISCGFLAIVYLFRNQLKSNYSLHNLIITPLIGGVFLAFYLAHYPLEFHGFLWGFISWETIPYLVVLFCLIEFGLITLVIWNYYRSSAFREDLLMILVILTLIPVYKMGYYNDWLMDVSIPVLFIFWVLVVRYLAFSKRNLQYWVVVFLIATSSFTPLRTIVIAFVDKVADLNFYDVPTPEYSPWVTELDFRTNDINKQYMGKTDSFFWKYLAKK